MNLLPYLMNLEKFPRFLFRKSGNINRNLVITSQTRWLPAHETTISCYNFKATKHTGYSVYLHSHHIENMYTVDLLLLVSLNSKVIYTVGILHSSYPEVFMLHRNSFWLTNVNIYSLCYFSYYLPRYEGILISVMVKDCFDFNLKWHISVK